MKTHNTDAVHQIDVTRGRKNTNRAGSGGIIVADANSEDEPIWRIQFLGATNTYDGEGGVLVSIGQANELIPDATIASTKDGDNPTFNFAALVENIVKVGSDYYVPYTSATVGDVKLATSTDRDGPWTHDSTIFAQTSVAWRGTGSLYAPEIVEVSGTFYLFYSIIVPSGVTSSSNAIGYATASVITGPYTDHGSAVLEPSAAGLWDSRRVGEPSVIFQGGQWVMAYMGEDSDLAYQASEKIGIATAPDPSGPWTRHPSNPVIDFGASGEWDDALTADPCLFYANGYYWMMYAGGIDSAPTTKAEQGLAYATSPTGPWTRHPDNPILTVGASGTWDDVWVFRGGLLYEDGTWSGIYTGYDGANFKGGNFRLDIDSALTPSVPVAGDILITDAGGYYTSSEVEGALQEVGADIALLNAGGVGHYEVIVSGSAPPVAVTNIAEDDWLYGFVAD